MTKLLLKNGRITRVATLPIVNCDNCGACCMHMGAPPGYGFFYADVIEAEATESPDYQRWLNLPTEVEAELREYYRAVHAGEIEDRTKDFGKVDRVIDLAKKGMTVQAIELWQRITARAKPIPCLWFDESTKRCRHYEHRPEVCRSSVAPGDDVCKATRRRFNILLPVAS